MVDSEKKAASGALALLTLLVGSEREERRAVQGRWPRGWARRPSRSALWGLGTEAGREDSLYAWRIVDSRLGAEMLARDWARDWVSKDADCEIEERGTQWEQGGGTVRLQGGHGALKWKHVPCLPYQRPGPSRGVSRNQKRRRGCVIIGDQGQFQRVKGEVQYSTEARYNLNSVVYFCLPAVDISLYKSSRNSLLASLISLVASSFFFSVSPSNSSPTFLALL